MKPQSISVILLLIGAATAFAQEKVNSGPGMSAVETDRQQPNYRQTVLPGNELEIVLRLEQIENEPDVQAKATAEAQVPATVFGPGS